MGRPSVLKKFRNLRADNIFSIGVFSANDHLPASGNIGFPEDAAAVLSNNGQANDLGEFFDPHHPAVLRVLKIAADAAHKAGIWIGICGELGADLALLQLSC